MLSYNVETSEVKDYRNPSYFNNGNCMDHEGRIIRCQHGLRRVIREENERNYSNCRQLQ